MRFIHIRIFYFYCLFSISYNLQIIISKIYLNPGTADTVITTILFLAFNWDFGIVLNVPLFSFSVFLSFIYPTLRLS